MKLISRIFLLLGIVVLMGGCKLAVIVVEGGAVQSTGSGTCVAGTVCIVDVTDPNFAETFTAVPEDGWYFDKWNSGGRFFCGGSSFPACTLSFKGYEESREVKDVVVSTEVFYLMPVFKPSKITSVDGKLIVNGKQWLQPRDFVNYSYNQVSAVCPGGVCSGTLPGSTFDLTGYTWASLEEVSALFNSYGLNPPFTGPRQRRDDDQNVDARIAQDFTITTLTCFGDCPVDHYFVAGTVRDPAPVGALRYTPYFHYTDDVSALPPGPQDLDFDNTDFNYFGAELALEQVGVWLWKPAE